MQPARSRRMKMIKFARQSHVKGFGPSALLACVGYGLVLQPVAGIEEANAGMMMGPFMQSTNIGASCEQAAYSLDELVECISEHMPADGSEGYVLPSSTVQSD